MHECAVYILYPLCIYILSASGSKKIESSLYEVPPPQEIIKGNHWLIVP